MDDKRGDGDLLRTVLTEQGWLAGDVDLDRLRRILVGRWPARFGQLDGEALRSLLAVVDTATVFERHAGPTVGSNVSLAELRDALAARFPGKYGTLTVAELGLRLRNEGCRVGTGPGRRRDREGHQAGVGREGPSRRPQRRLDM